MSKLKVRCAVEQYDGEEALLELEQVRTFNDWFDFADWVKQENLKESGVLIYEWHYEF